MRSIGFGDGGDLCCEDVVGADGARLFQCEHDVLGAHADAQPGPDLAADARHGEDAAVEGEDGQTGVRTGRGDGDIETGADGRLTQNVARVERGCELEDTALPYDASVPEHDDLVRETG